MKSPQLEKVVTLEALRSLLANSNCNMDVFTRCCSKFATIESQMHLRDLYAKSPKQDNQDKIEEYNRLIFENVAIFCVDLLVN